MSDRDARWYAVQTKSGAELAVEKQIALLGDGYRAFCPRYPTVVRTLLPNRRTYREQEVRKSFFPGYVFANIARWRPVGVLYSTRGVQGVLQNDGHPQRIPFGEVNRFLSKADASGLIDLPTDNGKHRYPHPFNVGDVVRFRRESLFSVLNFSLTAVSIIVERLDRNGMICLRIETAARDQKMMVPHWELGEIVATPGADASRHSRDVA